MAGAAQSGSPDRAAVRVGHRLWYFWPLTSTIVFLTAFPSGWALSRMRIDRGELIWGTGMSAALTVLKITISALLLGILLLVAAWSIALTDMRACRDDPGRSPGTALVVLVAACPMVLGLAVNLYIAFGPAPVHYR